MTDRDYLKQAIEVGNKVAKPYNFGAVVVKDGEVIAAEHGHVQETNDPSLHSEVSALAAAGKKLGNWQMDGATLYCSHEPCTMCFTCAAWAHIDRIVYVTSANEQEGFMYEFKEPNLQELVPKLTRPMVVEQVSLIEEIL
ncbi:MAG: nucleoside deaminase [Candidatus Saccharimonadales bacterium]